MYLNEVNFTSIKNEIEIVRLGRLGSIVVKCSFLVRGVTSSNPNMVGSRLGNFYIKLV